MMRRSLLLVAFVLLSAFTNGAQAQFCPGAAPWVFDDVPIADPFCGYITWAAEHGITLGCAVIDANHRLYCPGDGVTRGQMAAFVNRLGNVRVEAVGTGPGLTGGPITGVGTINLATTQLLPTTACTPGQIPQWSGSAWSCANAVGGGTVTSVGAGAGLAGGPITTTGTLSIATGYQLPQGCTNGQVAKSNGSNVWTCAADAGGGGGGTVTSVGTGTGLTGGPITTTGTIGLAATQLLPAAACANGQVVQWNGAAWACATPGNFAGNVNLPDSVSASVGNVTKPLGSFLHNFGTDNTFAGVLAGNFTMTGNANTAVGKLALTSNTSGAGNVAVGAFALVPNAAGSSNTAIGTNALANNTTGSFNTALGDGAMAFNTSTSGNTGLGFSALNKNTNGTGNTATGTNALFTNTQGSDNTGNGWGALYSNGTGSLNTAIGSTALYSNNTGVLNTATGAYALSSNTVGSRNDAHGQGALGGNVFGDGNTAVGYSTLGSNIGGAENVAIGDQALQNSDGSFNVAVGSTALASSTSGSNNVAVGIGAGLNVTSGSFNTAIGSGAGANVTTGSSNIHVGNTGFAADTQTIRIGDTNQTRAFVSGIRGVTTGNNNAVTVVVDSAGQLGTVSSSRKVKDDVADMGEASGVLMKLHPVTFRYKSHQGSGPVQYGLIAEEVAEVAPELVAPGRDGTIETVFYQHLAPMLLNEYQKQQRTIDAQARRIDAQQGEIAELRRAVEVLLARASSSQQVAAK